jgi:hypothetical protein
MSLNGFNSNDEVLPIVSSNHQCELDCLAYILDLHVATDRTTPHFDFDVEIFRTKTVCTPAAGLCANF